MTTALLLIDFWNIQNDYFPKGKWELHNTEVAVENGAKILNFFREKQLPIVHVRHEFGDDGPSPPPPPPNSEKSTIHNFQKVSVSPQEGEDVVVKHQVNCFRDTNLKEILDNKKIEKVVVVGAMTHMCLDAGVRAAADFGFSVVVVHDGCVAEGQEFNGVRVGAEEVHAAFMASWGFAYAKVVKTEELLGEMK